MSSRNTLSGRTAITVVAAIGLLVAVGVVSTGSVNAADHSSRSGSFSRLKSKVKQKFSRKPESIATQGGAAVADAADASLRSEFDRFARGVIGPAVLRAHDVSIGRPIERAVENHGAGAVKIWVPDLGQWQPVDPRTGRFRGSPNLKPANLRNVRITRPTEDAVLGFALAPDGAMAELHNPFGLGTFQLKNRNGEVFIFGVQDFQGQVANPETGAFSHSGLPFTLTVRHMPTPVEQRLIAFGDEVNSTQASLSGRVDGRGPLRHFEVFKRNGRVYAREVGPSEPRTYRVGQDGKLVGLGRLGGARFTPRPSTRAAKTVEPVLKFRRAAHGQSTPLVGTDPQGRTYAFTLTNDHGTVQVKRQGLATSMTADPRTGAFPGSNQLTFKPITLPGQPGPLAIAAARQVRGGQPGNMVTIKARLNGEGPVRTFRLLNEAVPDSKTGRPTTEVSYWEDGATERFPTSEYGIFPVAKHGPDGRITDWASSEELNGVEVIRNVGSPPPALSPPSGKLAKRRTASPQDNIP
jgi:hypothetical protein